MKLISLHVSKLFDYFNHTLNFEEENIHLITAPNGYGKTVCLKIIENILKEQFTYFLNIKFEKITLNTTLGALKIIKNKSSNELEITLNNNKKFKFNVIKDNNFKLPIQAIIRHIPFLDRISPDLWRDELIGDNISSQDVILRYNNHFEELRTETTLPPWLQTFCNSTKVLFIQDQRLTRKEQYEIRHRNNSIQYKQTILLYSKELSNMITEAGIKSASVSQTLDSSFPVRLIEKKEKTKPITDIKQELSEIQKRREELSQFGLINSNAQLLELDFLNEIKDEDRNVLTLYIKDTKEKLKHYISIYSKIHLFSNLLNKKNFTNKKVQFNQEFGFYFTQINENNTLPLQQLSSGEQHQIVLLYELIFKSEKNTIILIDEPEISLHVAWQKDFLSDLKEITTLKEMTFIIATHSPTIVGSNWELVTDLEDEEA